MAVVAVATMSLFADMRFTLAWFATVAFVATAVGAVAYSVVLRVKDRFEKTEGDKRYLEDEALWLLREKRNVQYQGDRVRRILENAADGYVEIGRAGKIQGWNSKAAEMFGWSSEDAIGKTAIEMLSPDNATTLASDALEQLWGYEGRFEGLRVEFMVLHRGGHVFPAEMTVWVDEYDIEPRTCAFIRDITVRKAADDKLQAALEDERQAVLRLQEIDKAKNDFVSSISHELRSPLTSTLGYLEILGDGGAGALNPEQAHMVEIADRNAKRLKTLIEDLLTLSRIESGAFGVKFRPVEISAVIAQAVASNAAFAQDRGVRVTVDVADVLGVCPGDDVQIARAIGNVVNNAVKFTLPTGKIRVSAIADGDHVIVQISDDGIGIPAHEQPQLFERFFRTSLSIEQQHQGAGLGLTITKAIVDHHGGSIDFDSTVGAGTDVRVRLPMLPTGG